MGCCNNKQTDAPFKPSLLSPDHTFRTTSVNLDPGEFMQSSSSINDVIFTIDQIELNALAFALIVGNTANFANLIENMKASVSAMESLLEKQGLNGLDIIIEKGYLALLQYYFPIYKSTFPSKFVSIKDSETLPSLKLIRHNRRLPIHLAVERGYIETLQYLSQCFQGTYLPDKYNLHLIDEHSGENAALIACRKCKVDIIKYLFENCKADFNVKSKRCENAFHLAAFGSKDKPADGLEVFRFLIEVVKVDFKFQFEETLLILENEEIVQYFERKLKDEGIDCTKDEVERKYCVMSYETAAHTSFGYECEFTVGGISSIEEGCHVNVSFISFSQDWEEESFNNK